MRKTLVLLPILLALTLGVSVCNAEEIDPWVKLRDPDTLAETDIFNVGEDVLLEAYCSLYPYDIVVYKPDGTTEIKTLHSEDAHYEETTVTGITDEVGDLFIIKLEPDGTTYTFSVGWYFVIPETASIVVVTACLAALILAMKKHPRLKL